ncbi:hypothetical protein AAG747_07945 [Rapidithrix thailandica]|uniref:Lipoprotein n=1 Tax=Rapidithrix thailandica TaxID=413964 RepID=A0AAW9SAT9_9BACT
MRNSIIFYFIVLLFSGSCRSIESKTTEGQVIFYESYDKSTDTYAVVIQNKKAGVLTYLVELDRNIIGIRTKPGYALPTSYNKDRVNLDFGYRYDVFMISGRSAGICEQEYHENYEEENLRYRVRFYARDKAEGEIGFIGETPIKGNRCLEEWYGRYYYSDKYLFPSPMYKVSKINYRKLHKKMGKKLDKAIAAVYEGKSFEDVEKVLYEVYKGRY